MVQRLSDGDVLHVETCFVASIVPIAQAVALLRSSGEICQGTDFAIGAQ